MISRATCYKEENISDCYFRICTSERKFMMDRPVCLCGDGHGAVAAFQSLSARVAAMYVLTTDEEVACLMRPSDLGIPTLDDLENCVIICAGYPKLIEPNVLKNNVIINAHPSLLPEYRGMHSLVWAMLNDEPEFGFSIHLMNDEIDDGDILAQFRVRNQGQDSAQIWRMFDSYVQENLADVVFRFLSGDLRAVPQDQNRATWVARRNLEDCEMNWAEPNFRLRALIRALVPPYPYPRLRTPKSLYLVTRAEIIDRDYYCTVGRVVGHLNRAALIKSADGLVRVEGLADIETGVEVPVPQALPLGLRLPMV
jgi:methionyl-tRNA formyltransferase